MATLQQIQSAFLGLAIGDALGVPVEFLKRAQLQAEPVTDMQGFGTHNQPAGTWSDDSSLTFCLADSLCSGYDLREIATSFLQWYHNARWTAGGVVFDIGNSTRAALQRLLKKFDAAKSGGKSLADNGNGSLMRILPLAFYLQGETMQRRAEIVREVSSITHAHQVSVRCCQYYVEFATLLLQGFEPFQAYQALKVFFSHSVPLARLAMGNIYELPEEEIKSGGYVVETLEAAMWCLLTTHSYEAAVLQAVNLGGDTDTTAAVVGGLAGLWYGLNAIPTKWLVQLVGADRINDLCRRFHQAIA